jgi:hypothetical protein
MCWKEKIQWQCYPRASERACVTFSPSHFGCFTRLQHDLPLDPIISPYHFHFQTFVTWLWENYDYRNVSWEMIYIYDLTLSKMRGGERNTCSFRSPWVTLPLNLFFPTHFVLFPSDLSCRWNCLSNICKSSPMIHCGNHSFLKVTWQMFENESDMAK